MWSGTAHELRLIDELACAPYFLTVHEVVRFARSKGILCQDRGSVANSTVCYVLGEPALIQEAASVMPAETAGQPVVLDYSAIQLTLHQHPLALLRPTLRTLGYHDTRWLNTARPGSTIRLPGIVLMRQRPGTAKGIVFITLEDEFGVANLVVYPNHPRARPGGDDRCAADAGRRQNRA